MGFHTFGLSFAAASGKRTRASRFVHQQVHGSKRRPSSGRPRFALSLELRNNSRELLNLRAEPEDQLLEIGVRFRRTSSRRRPLAMAGPGSPCAGSVSHICSERSPRIDSCSQRLEVARRFWSADGNSTCAPPLSEGVLIEPDGAYERQMRRFQQHDAGTPKPLRRQDNSERSEQQRDKILEVLSALHRRRLGLASSKMLRLARGKDIVQILFEPQETVGTDGIFWCAHGYVAGSPVLGA